VPETASTPPSLDDPRRISLKFGPFSGRRSRKGKIFPSLPSRVASGVIFKIMILNEIIEFGKELSAFATLVSKKVTFFCRALAVPPAIPNLSTELRS
jgi:hypothetical protein